MARTKPPTKREHRIEYRPLSGIRADPKNPKDHDTALIDGSMRRFGFIESIVVDDRTGMLISGHGRTETLAAMHAAGEDPPAGVRVAGDDWEVPVTVGWASADDVEASGALITLNRAGEVGGWVDDSLLALLDDLSADGQPGLEGVGFTDADMARLKAYAHTADMVANWVPAGDDGTDTVIPYHDDIAEVTVVVEAGKREALYGLLASVDWVLDARNKG